MRVLYVIHHPIFGGPHNQAVALSGPLKAKGWETSVIVADEPGNAIERMRGPAIDLIPLPLRRLRAVLDPRTQFATAADFWPNVQAIRRVIRQHEPDIVVVPGLVNPHGALAGRLEDKAVVWQLVDTRVPAGLRHSFMPLVNRLADVVMTTGPSLATMFPGAQAFGERLCPFFPPVDGVRFASNQAVRSEVRREWGVSDSDRVIGSTSNINPQKGIEFLIAALQALRRTNERVRLVLVGAEYDTHREYSSALRDQIRRGGLKGAEDVIFLGVRDDVERQLQGFDVFVMGSIPHSEGTPTSIIEAMACGIPVVATDVGGVSDLVEDNVTGFLVPALQPNAIADAVHKLLENQALRERLGEAGRQRAAEKFDILTCTETHLHAFEVALEHRESRRVAKAERKAA